MYHMYISDEDETVLFPVTPPKIEVNIKNQNKTVSLINEGEVNLIKAPGLTEISIDEVLLPTLQNYPFAQYDGRFQNASCYLNKLEKWKLNTTPVKFVLVRMRPSGSSLLWDTNMAVTIEDYEIVEDAKQGFDVKVKLKMKQYKYWGAKKLVKSKNPQNKLAKIKDVRKSKSEPKNYVVKNGDTLYSIARKQLNDGSRWKSIYTLNKKVIEDAARKHGRKSSSNGYWIYPGTKIRLPG